MSKHWFCRSDQHPKCLGWKLVDDVTGPVRTEPCSCKCHQEQRRAESLQRRVEKMKEEKPLVRVPLIDGQHRVVAMLEAQRNRPKPPRWNLYARLQYRIKKRRQHRTN